jgi:predicted helicase
MFNLKPSHKVIKDYYSAINELQNTGHTKEGSVAPYFANVLRHCVGLNQELDLVEQFTFKRDKRASARLDGALVDKEMKTLIYGVWEAKDESDNLDREIIKKIQDDDYPTDNILFQSPARVVLYQQSKLVFDKEIKNNPAALIESLDLFFSYQKPLYKEWAEAVENFKDKVGNLGAELVGIIEKELNESKDFKKKFTEFWELCRDTINPNISRAAIVEMLVQHLLTERLFRTIFSNPDFVRKNVIAKKLEEVIEALTARSFSRDQFLQDVERFYKIIEKNAATIVDYDRKQTFLNMLYEKFFQGFAVKVADTHGIVYTPQEIVSFMVESVDEILKTEFNKNLSSKGVHILDPFVGTGNFIMRVIEQISPLKLEDKYLNELHCNEVLLLPYYIASMNIEHAFHEKTGKYKAFEGICLVDTFEIIEAKQQDLRMFAPENAERVKRQKEAPIFVIIGNPPYNVGQINENDNNKNRKYPTLDDLVFDNYAKDSKATLKNALSDVYVKAFAWATKRLENQSDGVVAFVTNNGFYDGIAFDGMRKHLAENFNKIFILNLKGNARTSGERRRQEGGNIFDDAIRVGICITFLVKKSNSNHCEIFYNEVEDYWKKKQKASYISSHRNYSKIAWEQLTPNAKYTWSKGLHDSFDDFLPMGTKAGKASKSEAEGVIFKDYSNGVKTNSDAYVYNFSEEKQSIQYQKMVENYNAEFFRWKASSKEKEDFETFLKVDETTLKWIRNTKRRLLRDIMAEFEENKIRTSLYRPFTKQFYVFDRIFNEDIYRFPSIFPTPETEAENKVICCSAVGNNKPFHCLITNVIPDLHFTGDSQCFPFYTYSEDGSHRQENITNWALKQYQTHYKDDNINKWDIFYYVYGFLHHQGYRDKYQLNLKRELPRIPYAPNFWEFSKAGQQLAELHLNYEQQEPYELQDEIKGNLDWRVEKMRLSKDKTTLIYNDTLLLKGIPAKVFDYKLGNRSALQWVIEQYKVKTDQRSGIKNDPNNPEQPDYIFKLIGKIITVSLKTVDIVEQLNAQAFED